MNDNESIKRLTKLISALANGRVDEVEAESESFVSDWTNSEELKELQQEVIALAQKHLQAKEFILNLSAGNLDIQAPKGNRLIDPFKELQANLRHLVWQTREIAQGDYSQKIDFLGDFSDSFNSLVVALQEKKLMEESLRQSEDKFSKAFQNSPDIIVITSLPDGMIIDINDSISRIGDYTKHEFIGKTTVELNLWENSENRSSYMEKLQLYGNVLNFETTFKKKSGDIFTGLISGEIIQLKNEKYVLSVIHDITERKQMEDRHKESEARLRELNAAKDKFFSIIAHDLKGPFNSILGLSNLLVEQIQEKNVEGIEEYAGIIQNSSQRAIDLLMNLMEWSRSQTGRMEFSPEYIEMVTLINEVIELLGDSSLQKSITIQRELPRNMLAFIDKAMISAILRNLISNAIKFTHPGGRIVISAEIKNAELIISIRDNGVGIKKENIEKLFRIDENHSTLGTQNEKGTGLGLILCKEFIGKHGGKIWVESEVGKGSTFYFSIPKV